MLYIVIKIIIFKSWGLLVEQLVKHLAYFVQNIMNVKIILVF